MKSTPQRSQRRQHGGPNEDKAVPTKTLKFSHPKATSTAADAPIVVPHVTLNTAALVIALAAAQLAAGGRLQAGRSPLGDGRRHPRCC